MAIQGVRFIMERKPECARRISEYLIAFLKENRQNFDIMIGDSSQPGALLAGEVANIPTVVVVTGFPGGVENVVDKLGTRSFYYFWTNFCLFGLASKIQCFIIGNEHDFALDIIGLNNKIGQPKHSFLENNPLSS